jgi:mono/diheme cytochrome c family protein
MKSLITTLIAATIAVTPIYSLADHKPYHVDVQVPELSDRLAKGQKVFNVNCGGCHGINGAGSTSGPPLIHDIYNPGHHGNNAFIRAMQNGVRSHHWPFGDMPAQKQMGLGDMMHVIRFIRETQDHNGIKTKAHNM